ncbi:penicillin-binding transpeptidase domain-containing protein [Kitasatospora sp. NPDC096147]|uniref:penicillin-binding transpeptidase domain-containing protein n=1 Tax=Kitasatospora sp. NPDC096147 TaxID=3364093 RepID=UPI0038255DD3
MHTGVKVGIAAVTAAMFASGGYAAYAFISDVATDDRPASAKAAPTPEPAPTEPPSAQQATAGAQAFLAAWAKGDYEEAGQHTDKPETANAALAKFRDVLKPTSVALTVGGPDTAAKPTAGTELPLTFRAKVTLEGASAPWEYDGTLTMVKAGKDKAVVHWAPTVVHPKLDGAKTLSVQSVSGAPSKVVDRKGRPVTEFPSVAAVLNEIRFKGTESAPKNGRAVVASVPGSPSTPVQLFTITASESAEPQRLTLDADLQRAAEAAVAKQSGPASVVAIEPSTGNVLAFANNPPQGQNRAFGATLAPGSTMKVVTGAALLETGLTPDSPLPCPPTTTVPGGRAVPNDFDGARPGNTFKDDFAQSCNTAFLDAARDRLKPNSLPVFAKEVFGLGMVWDAGLPAYDTSVPVETNGEQIAVSYIGQGRIRTNALAMASVSATVKSGTFRQPILVPGTAQPKAARSLSAATLDGLRSMMRRTVQSGTATAALGSIPNAAGKTGTAEVGGQEPNSWFTGYRDNLAVAAEVQAGGHGGAAAAPLAGALLKVGNAG